MTLSKAALKFLVQTWIVCTILLLLFNRYIEIRINKSCTKRNVSEEGE